MLSVANKSFMLNVNLLNSEWHNAIMLNANMQTVVAPLSSLTLIENVSETTELNRIVTMEEHIFCIFIDYRGHHRKGVAMYDAT